MKSRIKFALISSLSLCMLSAGTTAIVASANENMPEEPTTSVAFAMKTDGASIRYNVGDGKNGIRFPIQVSKEVYETYKTQMTETGTIVTLEGAYTEDQMTVEAAKANDKDNLVYANTTSDWYPVDKNDNYTEVEEDITNYQTMVYFYNISNLDVNFTVKGYALVDGTPYYTTTEYRSMSYVADAAIKDNAALKEALEPYLADYTVTFNTDGGSAVDAQTVKYGRMATEPTAPTKDGYTFAGWDFDFTTAIKANTEVKAKWNVAQYTVTFDTDGGDSIAPVTVPAGTPASALMDLEATKEGKTFLYWTFEDGSAIPTDAVVTGDVTLKAVWGIGEPVTLQIMNKTDFLAMGQGYHEKELKWLTYELATDLEFANLEYTRVETVVGDGQCVNWDRVAYIMESLNCTLDGKGHTITVTYNKDVVASTGVVEAYPALFWTIGTNGVLKNVKIVANTITNFETTSVARYNYGVVENCYVDAYHMYMHEATKVPGPDTKQWIRNATGEIVDNYGTVRNCVFKIYTVYADGTIYTNTYAVRKTHEGGKVENCTVLGSTTSQFFSCDQYHSGASLGEPTLTVGNVATYRTNCYVFANVDDLKAGNGGMYNADGSITAGTYAEVINLYDGEYWATWFAPVA